MQQFLALLTHLDFDLDAEEVADLLWLASQQQPSATTMVNVEEPVVELTVEQRATRPDRPPPPVVPNQPAAAVSLPPPAQPRTTTTAASGLPFQAPTAPALRNTLELGRSLRPLMRKVPSRTAQILDEEATAIAIAESPQQPWQPVLEAASERWLDLALVVEDTRSTVIWQELIVEIQQLLERQGAFRTVRTWSLRSSTAGQLALFPRRQTVQTSARSRSPKELLDPTGRQLILLVSDCVSPLWRQGLIHPLLKVWADTSPTAIVQLFPERLWSRSALGLGAPVALRAFVPGVANSQLEVSDRAGWETANLAAALTLPIVTLDPDALDQWARVVSGAGNARTAGIVFDLNFVAAQSLIAQIGAGPSYLPAADLVQRFRATASPLARRLAGLMSVVPVSLPVVHLLQEAMLPASRQVHVAEIFMSGLLQAVTELPPPETITPAAPLAPARYEFMDGVRALLQEAVPRTETLRVLDKVSEYIVDRAGLSIRSFAALLMLKSERGQALGAEVLQFAEISVQVLRRMGGDYATWVNELDWVVAAAASAPASWQTFEFEVVTVEVEDELAPLPGIALEPFEFEMATLEQRKTGVFRRKAEWVIQRQPQQAWQFVERLTEDIVLDMVAIPAGEFQMGSPENELERDDDEGPQHRVTVPEFYLGKYPVTQAQWRVVAGFPEIERELNPDPANFRGDERPVEQVSWEEAVEFCARLSQFTRREYRLPSEAEWEYACRAGTTTPFHYGETITTDLANYQGTDWKYEGKTYPGFYGAGPRGEYREQTTAVGSFPANAFGLYDMHGNVWEWCLDHWHGNYEGAPPDGSAWLSEEKGSSRLLRGGSWLFNPWDCRSAVRYNNAPDYRSNGLGFRVVCVAARTM
jgi:formylglycine-generating enzyme required for sulfatase activity